MEKQISNRTSIGNTTNPALKVIALVAAFDIPERTSVMRNDRKYTNKKDLSLKNSANNEVDFQA